MFRASKSIIEMLVYSTSLTGQKKECCCVCQVLHGNKSLHYFADMTSPLSPLSVTSYLGATLLYLTLFCPPDQYKLPGVCNLAPDTIRCKRLLSEVISEDTRGYNTEQEQWSNSSTFIISTRNFKLKEYIIWSYLFLIRLLPELMSFPETYFKERKRFTSNCL